MPRVLPAIIGSLLLFLISPSFPVAAEPSAQQKPAYVAMYDQGKLEEATKELDKAFADKPKDDNYKIWKCMVELEKANIMSHRGEKGYGKIAFDQYLVLKPLLSRNSDNPYYWLAAAKAFAMNDSPSRARKAIEKGLYYDKSLPEARFIMIRLNEGGDVDETTTIQKYEALLGSKDITAVVSARSLIRISYFKQIKYKQNMSSNKDVFASKESKAEKHSLLKKEAIALLEKASLVAPESAYASIAMDKIKKLDDI